VQLVETEHLGQKGEEGCLPELRFVPRETIRKEYWYRILDLVDVARWRAGGPVLGHFENDPVAAGIEMDHIDKAEPGTLLELNILDHSLRCAE